MENEELNPAAGSTQETPAAAMPQTTAEVQEVNEAAVPAAEQAPVENEQAPAAKPVRAPRPNIEVTQEMLDDCTKTLGMMLDYLGLEGTVKAEKKPGKINLLVASEDAGRIIGRKGQSLENLQLLINRMMQKGDTEYPKIYIDIDGYSSKYATPPPEGKPRRDKSERPERIRREGGRRQFSDRREGGRFQEGGDPDKEERLREQAVDAAKEVRRWGESVTLPPMNSHDRRIVHITLENEPDLMTESNGDGAMKSIVVSLKK